MVREIQDIVSIRNDVGIQYLYNHFPMCSWINFQKMKNLQKNKKNRKEKK